MKKFYALLFFSFANLVAFADAPVKDVRVVQEDNDVILSFTVSIGNTCLGIDVERSTNGSNFTTIGHISGVCGSLAKDVAYNYTDTNPEYNQINYYRVKLTGLGQSETVSLSVVDYRNKSFVVIPVSGSNNVQIIFNRSNNVPYDFRLNDILGNEVMMRRNVSENKIEINGSTIKSGIYYFTLNDRAGNKISGKILMAGRQ